MTPAFVTALLVTTAPQAPVPEPTPAPTLERSSTPWAMSLSVEGVFRNWLDNEKTIPQEDILDGMNRFYGIATRGPVELGVQLDLAGAYPNDRAGLVNDATPPPGWTTGLLYPPGDGDAAVLEKKFARVRGDAGAFELGDVYRSVGRGLALALVKNTELDIDTSIEGASGDLTLGEHFEVAAWGGYSNPQTVSTAFVNKLRRDPRDRLAGARVGVRGTGIEAFAHGGQLDVDPRRPAQVFLGDALVSPKRAQLGGAGFAVPDLAGWGDLYFEADWVRYRIERTGIEEDASGRGFYGAASAYAGPLTIVLEGKRYQNLELMNVRQAEGTANPYDYSTPPPLEKENLVTKNLSEALNSNDITGAKLTTSWKLGKNVARATFAHFDDRGQRRSLYDANERIEHVYLGFERRWTGAFAQVTAGYRYETRLVDSSIHDTQAHVDADLLLPIGATSVELKYLAYRQVEHEPITGEEITFDVNDLVASVRPVRWLAVSAFVASTTDLAVVEGFLGRPGNLSRYGYGALEIAVEPNDRSSIRAFAGATQGGLKCSGGTCRVIPAFEGVRVEWLARF